MEFVSTQNIRPRQAPRSSKIQKPTGNLYTKRIGDKALPKVPARETLIPRLSPKPFNASISTSSSNPSSACTIGTASMFSSNWRNSASSHGTVFEEDFIESSDHGSAIVPLRISNSVKEILKQSSLHHGGFPLMIVLPVEEQSPSNVSLPATLPAKSPLSPATLATLGGSKAIYHARAASSLDGSLTSDDAASLSCPSTPNNESREGPDCDWQLPALLESEALESLRHLAPQLEDPELEHVIEVSKLHTTEMRECGLNINMIAFLDDEIADDHEPLSAISIPSPDGFFASLETPSRTLWSLPPEDVTPSTGTAERFYGVPWAKPLTDVVQQILEVHEDNDTDGPPTARQEMYTRQGRINYQLPPPKDDDIYDENYQAKLNKTVASHMSRTDLWISTQESYSAALRYAPDNPTQLPIQSALVSKPKKCLTISTAISPKKFVRFTGVPKTPVTAIPAGLVIQNDRLFLQAFQDAMREAQKQDVLVHATARADAIQMQRLYLSDMHQSQLAGHYKLRRLEEATQLRRDFSHLSSAPAQHTIRQYRDSIILADKERQATQQTALSRWNIAGIRCLNGGRLLPIQAHNLIVKATREGKKPRILDLDGIPTADWAWAATLEYSEATVYTTMLSAVTSDWRSHSRPSNHRVVTCPNPWTLPFSSDTFDVISARTLHTLLRRTSLTAVGSDQASLNNAKHVDEYQLTLSELHRVLRPSGMIHFSLLDAELTNPSGSSIIDNQAIARITALGSDFAAVLAAAGYDPNPSLTFAQKLRTAGFRSVTKANLCLRAGFPHQSNAMRDDCSALAEITCNAPITTPALTSLPPSTPVMTKATKGSPLKRDPVTPTTPKTTSTLAQKISSPALRRVFAGSSRPATPSSCIDGKTTTTPSPSSQPIIAPPTPLKKPSYPTLNLLAAAKKPFTSASPPPPAKDPAALPPPTFSLAPSLLITALPPSPAPPARPPPAPPTASSLPSEADSVAALASMVGAVAWERWMLKMQREAGREEARLLEGVAEALEAVGRAGVAAGRASSVGWRMCVGCARKGVGLG